MARDDFELKFDDIQVFTDRVTNAYSYLRQLGKLRTDVVNGTVMDEALEAIDRQILEVRQDVLITLDRIANATNPAVNVVNFDEARATVPVPSKYIG